MERFDVTLMLRSTARSDVGRVRAGNEDSGYAGPRLLVVADGMGGHAAGEVASAAAVRTILSLDAPEVAEPRAALRTAVMAANDRLRALVREDPAREGMGTTLTALLWRGTGFTIAHVGDSRAYVLRADELTQISHDHTFVQTLVDEGRISPDEAEQHPQRNLILRSLSGHARLDVDIDDIEARDGDRLLVCSDGLSGVVRFTELARLLGTGSIDDAADALVDAALAGGAPDNVTCVIGEVYDADGTGVLPAAAPAGMLVGAATDAAFDGTGLAGAGDAATEQPDRQLHDPADDDEELLRYAPRPPARFRWLRRFAVLVVAVALVIGVGYAGLAWTRTQYYIGVDGDQVAIYQGLDQAIAGRDLSEVHEVLPVDVDDLPTFDREQVTRSISASSLPDAESIGERLQVRALSCERIRRAAARAEQQADSPPTPSPSATQPAGGAAPGETSTAGLPSASSTATVGGSAPPSPSTTPTDSRQPSATPSPSFTVTPEPSETPPVEGDFDATVTAAECGVGAS